MHELLIVLGSFDLSSECQCKYDVSLSSQMPLKNLLASFGYCLMFATRNMMVAPNSYNGGCFVLAPSSEVVCLAYAPCLMSHGIKGWLMSNSVLCFYWMRCRKV